MEFQRFVQDVNTMIEAPGPLMDIPALQKQQSFAQFTASVSGAQQGSSGDDKSAATPGAQTPSDTSAAATVLNPTTSTPTPSKQEVLEAAIGVLEREFEQAQRTTMEAVAREESHIQKLQKDIQLINTTLAALQEELEEKTRLLQEASISHMGTRHRMDDARQLLEQKIQRLREALEQ